MIFKEKEHEMFYVSHKSLYMKDNKLDHNTAALIYALGMDEDCRDHFDTLYDKDTRCVCSDEDIGCWVTSTSHAVIRLAFDLYHDGPVVMIKAKDRQLDMLRDYSTANVFGDLAYYGLAQYGVQALQLRYNFS